MYNPISGEFLKLAYKNDTPDSTCPLSDHTLFPEPDTIKFLSEFYQDLMNAYTKEKIKDEGKKMLALTQGSGKTMLAFEIVKQKMMDLTKQEIVKRIPNSWDPILGMGRLATVYKKLKSEINGTPDKPQSHDLFSSYDEARFDTLTEVVGLLRGVMEPPPIIFLDMDGVMNPMDDWEPEKEWAKLGKPEPTERLVDMEPDDQELMLKIIYWMAPQCVKLLNEITDKTGAQIVISSSWRKSSRELSFFFGRGITGDMIGMTPELDGKQRGDEIAAWLKEHPQYTRFVILDDETDMAHLMDRLVLTDTDTGLTREIADEVLEKLS